MLVARELEPVVDELRAALGLGEPHHDPGVALFGLRNAVMALGDTFVEVVSPVREGTAAGRQLERLGGDGGYMVMVQVADTGAARARAAELGIRVAWSADLPAVSGTHLHPKDTGGTLLSLDTPRPPESWAWAGPGWTGARPGGQSPQSHPGGQSPQSHPGGLSPQSHGRAVAGATVATPDPEAVAARWRALLGGDGHGVRFVAGDRGLVAVAVAGLAAPARVAGVDFLPAGG